MIATIPVGKDPSGVAVSPDGSTVYVAAAGSNAVSVINTGSNSVIATIPVGKNPVGVAVTPDGNLVYVTNAGTINVSVINTKTNMVMKTITDQSGPRGIAVTPDGSKVYFANFQSFGIDEFIVSVIDTMTNMVVEGIHVGRQPFGVAVTPDGTKVYVANSGDSTVSVIDMTSNLPVVSTIPVGSSPTAFGLFIQPGPTFAGTPGTANCQGKSVAALAQKYGGMAAAAKALAVTSVSELQGAITGFCNSQ
jgi:YVTN family beta-propeller protein